LKQVDVQEGDRRVLREQLNELLQNPDDKEIEKRQVKVLQKLRDSVPGFYKDVVAPILNPLITGWMKNEMGQPPG
jgi:hypothetical protein